MLSANACNLPRPRGAIPAILSSGFLACADTAGNEAPGVIDDRLDYPLIGGNTYFLVIDSNEPDNPGDFTFFSHFGQCGAMPAPQCDVDADCGLGQNCTEQRQCIARIGTCEEPTEITTFGTYTLSASTARNQLEPARCDGCVNPGGGRCGEAVYHYRAPRAQQVCVSTEGSNYDTVLYARRGQCREQYIDDRCERGRACTAKVIVFYL